MRSCFLAEIATRRWLMCWISYGGQFCRGISGDCYRLRLTLTGVPTGIEEYVDKPSEGYRSTAYFACSPSKRQFVLTLPDAIPLQYRAGQLLVREIQEFLFARIRQPLKAQFIGNLMIS